MFIFGILALGYKGACCRSIPPSAFALAPFLQRLGVSALRNVHVSIFRGLGGWHDGIVFRPHLPIHKIRCYGVKYMAMSQASQAGQTTLLPLAILPLAITASQASQTSLLPFSVVLCI